MGSTHGFFRGKKKQNEDIVDVKAQEEGIKLLINLRRNENAKEQSNKIRESRKNRFDHEVHI